MSDDTTPGELARMEAQLRRAFAAQADSVVPGERLAQIRAQVAAVPGHRSVPRWVAPAAASVAILLVASVAWLLLRPAGPAPVVVGTGTETVTVTDPTATEPEATPTGTGTATSSGAPAVGSQALPVYYVARGTTAKPWLLYRTFLPDQSLASDPSGLATAAVAIALSGQDAAGRSLTAYEGYLQPWRPGTTATVTVAADEIRIVLGRPGLDGLAPDQQRIAVQQLVWTATAAASANRPVRVTTASGAPVFATVPGGVFRRPAAAYEDLAPLWITEPSRYVPVAAGRPVVVTGQACVFEAQFSWELGRGGSVIRSGTTMATSGCPERGTYSIDLGVLPAGEYSIRVFELSAADGSVFSETRMPFTVR